MEHMAMQSFARSGVFSGAMALALMAGLFAADGARAADDLSAVEKLYADLYKLPAAEREKKILEGARKEKPLNFLTGIRGRDGIALMSFWTKKYPDIKIDRSELGAQDAAARIYSEEKAGRHLTDVGTMSVADTALLLQENYTARYQTPATDRVLPQYKQLLDPDHRYIPWLWSEHGIAYNPEMLKPEDAPKDWFDLCKPHLKGQVSFDPLENRFLTGMLAMMGDQKIQEWLQCVGKNEPIIMRGHTVRLNLMMAGDHAVMGENYFYQGTLLNEKNPKKAPFKAVYTAPVLGYANIELINRNAPSPYTAALYLDWSIDEDAQNYMASLYRAPVTVKHPFMPDNIPLVLYGAETPEMSERLAGYWNKFIGASR
jgi:iron(III) transport system substrate-binding protein